MLRVVVDTNVLVSAVILPASPTGAVVLHLRQGAFTPLYSAELLEELARVLARPRIRDKYHIIAADIRTILDLILLRGEFVEPVERVTVCRDPKDNVFLEVALAGRAEVIVTGDDDLLGLHPFRGIPIITPAAFLANYPWSDVIK
jgi:putative PIN family toxin of toxin-antitoxin system